MKKIKNLKIETIMKKNDEVKIDEFVEKIKSATDLGSLNEIIPTFSYPHDYKNMLKLSKSFNYPEDYKNELEHLAEIKRNELRNKKNDRDNFNEFVRKIKSAEGLGSLNEIEPPTFNYPEDYKNDLERLMENKRNEFRNRDGIEDERLI